MAEGYNITLIPSRGEPKNSGKIVPYNGNWIYHAWAVPTYRRRDANAYGVSETVYTYCGKIGVVDFYLYRKSDDTTLHISDEYLLMCSFVTDTPFGSQLNVSEGLWEHIPGRINVPYIPAHIYRPVDVVYRELPTIHTESEPVSPQLSLFDHGGAA